MDASVVGPAEPTTAIQSTPPAPAATPPTVPPTQPARPAPSVLQACPPPAQWILVALLSVTLILIAVQAYGFLPLATHPAELDPGEPLLYRLELNRATKGELQQLPGIGPKMADRILEYRDRHGKFQSVADLSRIPGFGPATLKRLEGWVYVESESEPVAVVPGMKVAAADKPPPKAKATTSTSKPAKGAALHGSKINVNSASQADLQKLPRIGPVLSQRIIDERGKKLFQTVDDLRRVKGIGPKTLENLRPYVTVGE